MWHHLLARCALCCLCADARLRATLAPAASTAAGAMQAVSAPAAARPFAAPRLTRTRRAASVAPRAAAAGKMTLYTSPGSRSQARAAARRCW